MKRQILLFAIVLLHSVFAEAQIPIYASYFGAGNPTYIWGSGNQYLICEDIKIPNGSDLIIEPGVEVLFASHFKIDVFGSINAIGDADNRIIFTSDEGNPWNGIRFDFSDNPSPAPSKFHYCDISNAQKTGTECTFPDPESSGGAIFVKSFSDLEIYECEIFNNSVEAQGGAIGLYNSSSPEIWECNIHNNSADERGGGLCMMIDCAPVLSDNTFEESESVSKGGGAIAIGDLGSGLSCSPTITGNIFLNNSAMYYGGGVFICNSDIINFSNNTFEGNVTQESGGAICIQKSSTVNMGGNVFLNNQSSINGGGVYIALHGGSLPPDVTIELCQFSENSAINGGGIYLNQSELDISYCEFTSNTASNHGGGIYVLNSVSSIKNCSFEENSAAENGGGIFMNDPLGGNGITPSSINLNNFKSNTAYHGSALYLYRNIQTLNYTGDTKILNNLFVENHATVWGVVFLQGNNNNTIFNHNTVSNNTADTWISGVCVEMEAYFPDVVLSKNFHNNIIFEAAVDLLMIATFTHPTIYSTLTTFNHFPSNPGFVSSTDYHLSSTSPCIDAGDNYAPMTSTDLDGNQRTWNGNTDYGCYEYGSYP